MYSRSGSTTRLENLTTVYKQLGEEFKKTGNAKLLAIAESWGASFSQLHTEIGKNNLPAKPTALVAGLEQGLRETPSLLSGLPEEQHRLAIKVFQRVIESNLPGFFEKELETLEKIIARGKIKSEKEWYLVRQRVDEIEGDDSRTSELMQLYTMTDAYESTA